MSVTYSTRKGPTRCSAMNAQALSSKPAAQKSRKAFMLKKGEIKHDPAEKLPEGEIGRKGKRTSSNKS